MLSVVILFCDRDTEYIPSLLNTIKDRLHNVDYEIILIDNRENNHDDIDTDGCTYYAFGFNATQVQGRKKGVELAKGDYIWFVDGDDEVIEIPTEIADLLNHDYDIITFMSRTDELQTDNVFAYWTLQDSGCMLWNKWIKTDILRKVEELIPTDLYGSASEDTMLVIGCLKFAKNVYYSTFNAYVYVKERSCCAVEEIKDVERYKRIIRGHTEITRNITKMLTAEERKLIGWDTHRSTDCRWFLDRLAACVNSIKPQCAELFEQHFTPEEFREAWLMYSTTAPWHMDKAVYDTLKRELQKSMSVKYRAHLNPYDRVRLYKRNDQGQEYCYKEYVTPLPDWSLAKKEA